MISSLLLSNSASPPRKASSSGSSVTRVRDFGGLLPLMPTNPSPPAQPEGSTTKRKRNSPGNPDPEAEVVALSPETLLATNRFVCEVCKKGFQRDQNLQLHRRGHNISWSLTKQTTGNEIKKKVYVCPVESCVHHDPSRALGDLTGIKKHYSRKHCEKTLKCDKCDKVYAVHSDWKAHNKICGTKAYRCECDALFSRRDCFMNHKAFCEVYAEQTTRLTATQEFVEPTIPTTQTLPSHIFLNTYDHLQNPNPIPTQAQVIRPEIIPTPMPMPISAYFPPASPPPPPPPTTYMNLKDIQFEELNLENSAHIPATLLLENAAILGSRSGGKTNSSMAHYAMGSGGHVTNGGPSSYLMYDGNRTRNFLGLAEEQYMSGGGGHNGNGYDVGFVGNVNGNNNEVSAANMAVPFTGGLDFAAAATSYGHEFPNSMMQYRRLFGLDHESAASSDTWGNR